ncbi:unnamed protein product, partial [Linum tenue]
ASERAEPEEGQGLDHRPVDAGVFPGQVVGAVVRRVSGAFGGTLAVLGVEEEEEEEEEESAVEHGGGGGGIGGEERECGGWGEKGEGPFWGVVVD